MDNKSRKIILAAYIFILFGIPTVALYCVWSATQEDVFISIGAHGVLTVYYRQGTNVTDAIVNASIDVYRHFNELYSVTKQVSYFKNASGGYIAVNLTFTVLNNTIERGCNKVTCYVFTVSDFVIRVTGKINANITVPAVVGTYTYRLEGRI